MKRFIPIALIGIILIIPILISSCNNGGSKKLTHNNSITFNTKYYEIEIEKSVKHTINYINETIEIDYFKNNEGSNISIVTYPFLIPNWDFLTEMLFKEYDYLRKNYDTTDYIDDFCDTLFIKETSKNCFEFTRYFKTGMIEASARQYGNRCVYSSQISKNLDEKISLKQKFRNEIDSQESESFRRRFHRAYIDSLNNCFSENDDWFPVKSIMVDENDHNVSVFGNFNKTDSDYFIEASSFFMHNAIFLSLSLFYLEENHLSPYNIMIINNETNEIIATYTISSLFDQWVFMTLFSRMKDPIKDQNILNSQTKKLFDYLATKHFG